MSVADTNAPSPAKNAIESGRIVSFIQNEPEWSAPKRKSIPSAPPSEVTPISPCCRCSPDSASQTQNSSVVPSSCATSMTTAE